MRNLVRLATTNINSQFVFFSADGVDIHENIRLTEDEAANEAKRQANVTLHNQLGPIRDSVLKNNKVDRAEAIQLLTASTANRYNDGRNNAGTVDKYGFHDEDHGPDVAPPEQGGLNGAQSVLAYQSAMAMLGQEITIDAIWGRNSANALKVVQQQYNDTNGDAADIKVDGIPGPKSAAALAKMLEAGQTQTPNLDDSPLDFDGGANGTLPGGLTPEEQVDLICQAETPSNEDLTYEYMNLLLNIYPPKKVSNGYGIEWETDIEGIAVRKAELEGIAQERGFTLPIIGTEDIVSTNQFTKESMEAAMHTNTLERAKDQLLATVDENPDFWKDYLRMPKWDTPDFVSGERDLFFKSQVFRKKYEIELPSFSFSGSRERSLYASQEGSGQENLYYRSLSRKEQKQLAKTLDKWINQGGGREAIKVRLTKSSASKENIINQDK